MSNSPFTVFETDASVETKGIKIDYGDFWVYVARAGGANTKFLQVLRAKMSPHKRAFELAGDAPSEHLNKLADRLSAEAFSETVIMGWGSTLYGEGHMIGRPQEKDGKQVLKDGKPVPEDIPFSVDAAKALFAQLPEFYKDVANEATKMANFRKTLQEADAKN